jgi:hypothetical protein
MYLGSDGKYHLRLHDCAGQKIVIPQPLANVLARRCDVCGTPQEYEAAQQQGGAVCDVCGGTGKIQSYYAGKITCLKCGGTGYAADARR